MAATITTVLLALGWLLLAPVGVGGSATWVVPHGASMSPLLGTDDLAVLRPAASYRVGDVVAYRSTELHTTVLHRIVDRADGRFVTAGDANSWRDPDRVRPDQILGTLWFHIPGGGRVLTALHNPWTLALLTLAVLLGLGWLGGKAARGHGRRRADDLRPHGHTHTLVPTAGTLQQAAVVAAAAAVGLAAISLTAPADAGSTRELAYTHRAALSYTAPVATPGIYDADRVRTGDPIYLELTPTVQTRLLLSADPRLNQLRGRIAPVVQVRAGNGWQRTIPAGPTRPVTGQTTELATAVDLAAAHRLVRTAEQRSGVSLGGYTLTLLFRTQLRGEVHGHPVSDTFAPRLSFTTDGQQAVLDGGTTSGAPVHSQEQFSILTATPAAASVPLLGWHASTTVLQAAAGVLAMAAGVLGLWWWRRRMRHATSPAALFGRRLVTATAVNLAGRTVVDVTDLATLDRLASHHDVPVVWARDQQGSCYHVEAAGTIYRHRLVAPSGHHQPVS